LTLGLRDLFSNLVPAMRPLIPLILAALACAAPAVAQNATQIARAKAGSSCAGCNLFQADFSNTQLKGRSFTRSRLRQADFSAAVMSRTSFAGADLRDVNGYGGVFAGADFAHADLTHASFVGAYLQGANFDGAKLDGADFSGAEMARARGLSQRQLDAACGDSSTTLPLRLHLRPCR
jgi:uncharacterized protein YjbI with pentapeptide repeats